MKYLKVGKREISYDTVLNESNVSVTYFFKEDGTMIAHMYRTSHPTIPYKVFRDGENLPINNLSKRVNSEQEAAEWLCGV